MKQMLPIILILGIIVFLGWYFLGNGEANYKLPETPKIQMPMINALDSFYKIYPNWDNNDATRKQYTDSLNAYLIKRGIKDFYKNLPFEFTDVEASKKVNVGLFHYRSEYSSPIEYSLDIYGILDNKAVDTLKQNTKFFIEGEVIGVKEPAEIWFKKSINLPTLRMKVAKLIPVE